MHAGRGVVATTGRRRVLLSLPLLLLCALGLSSATHMLVASIEFTRAETEASFWGRENYQPSVAAIAAADVSAARALENWPGNPDYLSLLARIRLWQAHWASDEADALQLALDALALQSVALQARPAHVGGRRLLEQYSVTVQRHRERVGSAE